MKKEKNTKAVTDASENRVKLFIQLLNVKRSEQMTRAYMAMKTSSFLNPKN